MTNNGMRPSMYAYERDVLEAICKHVELEFFELEDLAGWCQNSCMTAIWRLKRSGMVYKPAGKWRLTERGKILLAITMGKESRARSMRQRTAA